MARPTKTGMDYFPLVCNVDDKIKLIQAEFGLTGFALVVKLFQKIYGERGYYCEWTRDVALLFSQENGLGYSVVSEIVNATVRRGIFDKDKFEKYGILTSRRIQQTYFDACQRRKNIFFNSDYLLISVTQKNESDSINSVNDSINSKIVNNNTQSKVNQIKVNKNKECSSSSPVAKATPKEPESYFIKLILNDNSYYYVIDEEVKEYKTLYPNVNVEQQLRNMAGWLNANQRKRKTKRGIKRFINSWLSKEQDRGGYSRYGQNTNTSRNTTVRSSENQGTVPPRNIEQVF